MTSANVTEYTIYKGDKRVGSLRKHHLTKYPDFSELLKYQPLHEHEIEEQFLDENEETWYHEPENLLTFMKRISKGNSIIKAYFDNHERNVDVMEVEEIVKLLDKRIAYYLEDDLTSTNEYVMNQSIVEELENIRNQIKPKP